MITLKSLLLNRADRCDDLRVHQQNIQQAAIETSNLYVEAGRDSLG
jgi:hypothetical protein